MKLTLRPFSKDAAKLIEPPTSARKYIPEWYRDMPALTEGETVPGFAEGGNEINRTLKGCVPFLDALTAGYILELPVDVEMVRDETGIVTFKWRTPTRVISHHPQDQYPGMPTLQGEVQPITKWNCEWSAITPPGYSILFTHPFNRHDLPFRTFTGIVDADRYTVPTQFPFEVVSDNFNGRMIIERGTPIVQMIPFKRDEWDVVVEDFDADVTIKSHFDWISKIISSYKTQYWTKKQW